MNFALFVFVFWFLMAVVDDVAIAASIAASSEADWNAMKMRYIQTIRIDFQNSLYM